MVIYRKVERKGKVILLKDKLRNYFKEKNVFNCVKFCCSIKYDEYCH